LKQARADVTLQSSQRAGDRGRRTPQLARGSRQAAGVEDAREHKQLVEAIHRARIIPGTEILRFILSLFSASRARSIQRPDPLMPSSGGIANRVIWKTRETDMGPCKQVLVCVLLLSSHATAVDGRANLGRASAYRRAAQMGVAGRHDQNRSASSVFIHPEGWLRAERRQ
jgi:hypothetical protein